MTFRIARYTTVSSARRILQRTAPICCSPFFCVSAQVHPVFARPGLSTRWNSFVLARPLSSCSADEPCRGGPLSRSMRKLSMLPLFFATAHLLLSWSSILLPNHELPCAISPNSARLRFLGFVCPCSNSRILALPTSHNHLGVLFWSRALLCRRVHHGTHSNIHPSALHLTIISLLQDALAARQPSLARTRRRLCSRHLAIKPFCPQSSFTLSSISA